MIPNSDETRSIKPSDAEGHILVVDDDGQIRQLVAKFLRENGHRVTVAPDGREMRQVLADATIDLVILDLMLPGTSGLDLCRELRKTSAIPIVMLTARGPIPTASSVSRSAPTIISASRSTRASSWPV